MSNTNTSSNIDITFNNFGFDLETMKFIGTLFKNVRSSKVEKLVDALRWWGAERSGNQSLAVTYQIRAAKLNEQITSGTEYVNVAVAGEHENEDAILSVILATGLKADGSMAAIVNKVAPLDALTIYDTRLAAVKPNLPGPFLAAYVSLRHQIATAARMADHAEVKEHSITFEIEDGEVVHAFKVVVAHFALTDAASAPAA